MPFDFGGFDIGGDFPVSDFSFEAVDIGSAVDNFGGEFLTVTEFTTFDVPYEDIAGFGGYEIAGTVAGDSNWFDAFYGGDIVNNPTDVAESSTRSLSGLVSGADVARTPGFGFPDVLEEPASRTFGQQIQSIATQVQTDFTGFIKGSQQALQAYQKIAPLVNVVTAALKIPNPINQLIQPFQQAVGIAGVVADTAGSVRAVGNAVSAASTVSSGGTGYKPVTGGPPVVDSVAPRTVEEITARAAAGVSPGQITNGPVLQITPDGAPVQLLPGPGQIVTSAGVPADAPFRELSDAETRALIARTIDPRLINSAADSGLPTGQLPPGIVSRPSLRIAPGDYPSQETYDTAIITRSELGPESIRLREERDEIVIKLGTNDQRIRDLEFELTDSNLSQRARDEIALELINLQTDNGVLEQEQFNVEKNLLETNQQLIAAENIILTVNDTTVKNPAVVPGGTGTLPPGIVARPSLRIKPGDFPPAQTPISYDTAIITRAELGPEEIRLREERNEIVIKLGTNDQAIKNLESQLSNPDLTDAERDNIARELIVLQAENGELEAQEAEVRGALTETRQQLANANAVIAQTNASAVTGAASVPSAPGVQYESIYNPTTGTYSIYDRVTGETAVTGLTEQQARQQLIQLGVTAAAIALNTTPGTINAAVAAVAGGAPVVDSVAPRTVEQIQAQQNAVTAGLTAAARDQQTIRSLRNNKAQSSDWRVRLRLAPGSNYLYNDPTGAGVMTALRVTDGVIFPYTPSIETAYKANYTPYDLTHSNYRGYFYQNSYVDAINVRATFTAQDTNEADYLLAVIHFFRSATKMFYGSTDTQRGAPPPLVYLNGYGDFQFSEHPCVISQFNYTLPPDVDYIRSQNWLNNSTNLQLARLRNPIANNPLAYSVNRILNSGLFPGAKDFRPPITNNLADGNPTYVPTKMEISISLLPIQSRQQVSQNFSVSGFAKGNLLKGGYW